MPIERDEIFSMETVLMAVLLSVAGWASVEIFTLKGAMATVETRQIFHEDAVETLEGIKDSLVRVEESQIYFKESIKEQREDLKDLSRHVRLLHSKE